MEQSILKSVRKIAVGDGESFDEELILHINSAFGVLYQLGVGAQGMFTIEDDSTEWADYGIPTDQLALAKQYIQLSTRREFDPDPTSFTQDARAKKLAELEGRLRIMVETV